MYQGKYGAEKRRKNHKPVIAIISLIAIMVSLVGGTIAYLVDKKEVTNTFTPGKVTCLINEQFAGGVKSSITVTNTGNTPAKIRVRIVATWVKEDGTVYGGAVPNVTVNPAKGWRPDGNYFVYDGPVAPGGVTTNLLANPITSSQDAPEGCYLVVEVLADAIQSEGDANWGNTPTA